MSKEAKASLKACVGLVSKAKRCSVLSLMIDTDTNQIVIADKKLVSETTAAAIGASLDDTQPRYHFIFGGGLKKSVFVYSCPTESHRGDRMLYATTKQSVIDAISSIKVRRRSPIFSSSKPSFLFYWGFSVPRCVPPYTCRNLCEMLFKLMTLCGMMGSRPSTRR